MVSGETSSIGQNRSSRVRDVLKRAGLDVVPGVDVNLAPNTVNIVLTEQVVTEPPRCGDWPLFAGDAPSNAPSLYLGCAMRNNLYLQASTSAISLSVGHPVPPMPSRACARCRNIARAPKKTTRTTARRKPRRRRQCDRRERRSLDGQSRRWW